MSAKSSILFGGHTGALGFPGAVRRGGCRQGLTFSFDLVAFAGRVELEGVGRGCFAREFERR